MTIRWATIRWLHHHHIKRRDIINHPCNDFNGDYLNCVEIWVWSRITFYIEQEPWLLFEVPIRFNSLASRRFEINLRKLFFMQILLIHGWGISGENVLTWAAQDLTDDKSTFFQVMDWCRQATRHYLSQCWPRSMSPYGVISHNELMSNKTTSA